VIGHENDDGVVSKSFGVESFEDGSNVVVCEADGVEVGVPVLNDEWVSGVVGREAKGVWVEGRAEE
jgi:hypothetical protein